MLLFQSVDMVILVTVKFDKERMRFDHHKHPGDIKRSCISRNNDVEIHKGPDFAMFLDFSIFVVFLVFESKMNPNGPGRASKGFGEAFRFIWTKFQPKWAHSGPFLFFNCPETHFGPK